MSSTDLSARERRAAERRPVGRMTADRSAPGRPRFAFEPPSDARLGPARHHNHPVKLVIPESLEEWKARAAALERRILFSAGLLPLPERAPLEAKWFDPVEGPGFTVYKVLFQSLPDFWVTGNLFVPEGNGPFPAVLNPHGHWAQGRLERSEKADVPARAATFARMGAVALTLDMVGYLDSRQVEHRAWGVAERLWGIGPLGLQLWNNMRALDFLQSLPFVDGTRLGCTGASGGGTQTFLLTAVDERVRVSAPVNMISAHMHGGCICENAPMLRIDANNIEFGAMAAPRPMLMVSCTGDWTCNTPDVEYPAVRRVYELYGCPERLESVHIDAPHNYNAQSRRHVHRFFARHLLGREDLDVDALEAPLPCPVERLRLSLDGSLPLGAPSQEALVKRWKESLAARTRLEPHVRKAHRRTWGEQLREVFGAREIVRESLRIRVRGGWEHEGLTYRSLLLGTAEEGQAVPAVLVWSASASCGRAAEVEVGGEAEQPRKDASESPSGRGADSLERAFEGASVSGLPPLLAASSEGVDALLDEPAGRKLLREVRERGRLLLVVEPFLTGSYLSGISAAGRNTGVAHFDTYNVTDAVYRVQDLMLGAKVLSWAAGRPVELVGCHKAGLWGVFAMALASEIQSASLDLNWFTATEEAWLHTFYVPHLLRVGGLQTAFSLCAPRRLELCHASMEVHRAAERAYAAAGAAERVRVLSKP